MCIYIHIYIHIYIYTYITLCFYCLYHFLSIPMTSYNFLIPAAHYPWRSPKKGFGARVEGDTQHLNCSRGMNKLMAETKERVLIVCNAQFHYCGIEKELMKIYGISVITPVGLVRSLVSRLLHLLRTTTSPAHQSRNPQKDQGFVGSTTASVWSGDQSMSLEPVTNEMRETCSNCVSVQLEQTGSPEPIWNQSGSCVIQG